MTGDKTDVTALVKYAQSLEAEIGRLRAYIESLDGKTICIAGENNTFIDDGVVVASDIIGSHEQREDTE